MGDCTACGVGCGGGGQGSLAYVGSGQGDYIQETTYKYVGCGGDFARPRRDFTCLITTCCLLSLLLLIPLLLWLLAGTWASHSGRLLGLQRNSSSAAQRWEGAAPQLSLRPLPPFHQRPRRLRRQLSRRLRQNNPVDLWIPSTAQLIPRTPGPLIRRSGAAESITVAALQPHRRSPSSPSSSQFRSLFGQPILTIAPMVSQTGKQVGPCQRRTGAAEFMARAVRIKAVAA